MVACLRLKRKENNISLPHLCGKMLNYLSSAGLDQYLLSTYIFLDPLAIPPKLTEKSLHVTKGGNKLYKDRLVNLIVYSLKAYYGYVIRSRKCQTESFIQYQCGGLETLGPTINNP